MKKSSKPKRSKRSRSPSTSDVKTKVLKSTSKSKEGEMKSEEKVPRKTRWQTQESPPVAGTDKPVDVAAVGPPQRIRDLIGDKEKLLEYLFLTVTGTALEELIPDYLKKYSLDELKRLCAEQIKDMSEESILNVISEVSPETKEEKPKSSTGSDSQSGDVLELCASASEMRSIISDEESQSAKPEEAIEDLRVPESDADLLELEMRARAIRSLLKAKNQELDDSDTKDPHEE